MGKIIAYINEKGGVGKSSICYNVGWALAEQGRKVLMVDLDGQRANLTFIAGIEKPEGLLTIADVLTSDLDVKQTVKVVEDRLHIIPATDVVATLDKTAKVTRMEKAMDTLRPYYDYIFIDVSPTPNRGHVLALSVADGVIIPMLPDVTSLEANMGVVDSIALAQLQVNPGLKVYGVVLNKYTWRTLLSSQVTATANKMADAMDTKVFKTKIRQGVALSENVGAHQGVTAYAPRSKCAEDILSLCREIEEVCNHE